MSVFKNILSLFCFCAVLLGLSGCAAVTKNVTAPPLPLTPKEEARVGAAVEGRLLQLLGGPYYDKALANDLRRFCAQSVEDSHACKISVADRSAQALYPLPDGHIIMTRGLLTVIRNGTELKKLLAAAVKLSADAYSGRATRGMNDAIKELLSNAGSPHNPDSADIRIARLFKQTSCERECLEQVGLPGNGRVDSASLPESVRRLVESKPGYELLVRGRAFEEAGDQKQSVATYLQAATTTADEPRILGALGLAYLRAGQLQSARLYLQRAVTLQPDYYRTLMGLGYLYLQFEKNRQANKALTESVGLLPVSENLFLLAKAREKNGNPESARSLYRVIVEHDRNSKLGRTAASRLETLAGGQ